MATLYARHFVTVTALETSCAGAHNCAENDEALRSKG